MNCFDWILNFVINFEILMKLQFYFDFAMTNYLIVYFMSMKQSLEIVKCFDYFHFLFLTQ